jgi:septal ring factor EnvC (AmiA/AmiB activator)
LRFNLIPQYLLRIKLKKMQKLILIILLISPLHLISQDTQTEFLIKELGYEKVDMAALAKKQAIKKPCSTCPMKKNTSKKPSTVVDSQNEIKKLKSQIPNLEQNITTLQNAPQANPAMLQKYQQALADNIKRIKDLQGQQTPSKTNNH